MPSSAYEIIDRKSTRLNSSHTIISYAVSLDRKSTRLNSSHTIISYAVFCLKKKKPAVRNGLAMTYVADRVTEIAARVCAPPPPPSLGSRAAAGRSGAVRRPMCLFFNDTATTEIYTLSLHDALPINDTATTEIYTLSLHDAFRSRWSPYHLTVAVIGLVDHLSVRVPEHADRRDVDDPPGVRLDRRIEHALGSAHVCVAHRPSLR